MPISNATRLLAASAHLQDAAAEMAAQSVKDARDWSGFLAALIAAAKELLPIILPLLTK